MTSFFQTAPQFIQNYQNNLKSWIHTAPEDAVWGCAKSMMGSFVITALYTQGNIIAAAKAAIVASVASVVHTLVISSIMKGINSDKIPITKKHLSYIRHGVSLLGLLTSYLLGRNMGMSLLLTIPATAFPYFLTQSQRGTHISTPLFLTVVN